MILPCLWFFRVVGLGVRAIEICRQMALHGCRWRLRGPSSVRGPRWISTSGATGSAGMDWLFGSVAPRLPGEDDAPRLSGWPGKMEREGWCLGVRLAGAWMRRRTEAHDRPAVCPVLSGVAGDRASAGLAFTARVWRDGGRDGQYRLLRGVRMPFGTGVRRLAGGLREVRSALEVSAGRALGGRAEWST